MSAILPFVQIDSESLLARYFTPYQIAWIEAEVPFHAQKKQVFALAEKSVRIGWTFCDGFKNVRKRLRFKKRDYLFVTKDWPSSLEYMNQLYDFMEILGYTRAVLTHGEDILKVPCSGPGGNPTSLTEEVKIGKIKFDNGSRIIAFSSNPYAMAVYGGDVGLDEFAKHPNPEVLWQTAQSRVTWNKDLAVWSSHDGEDTLFNQFARQARAAWQAGFASGPVVQPPPANGERQTAALESPPTDPRPTAPAPAAQVAAPAPSKNGAPAPAPAAGQTPKAPVGPWNLYFRVTMPDAIEQGLLDVINRTQNASFTADQFLADCRTRSTSEEIFQQSYMCNPLGADTATIVPWSAIERCCADYKIERLHLEADQILREFGHPTASNEERRAQQIRLFLKKAFPALFANPKAQYWVGFDVAASGEGNLAAFYIEEVLNSVHWLRALLTARTEDWHFLGASIVCLLLNFPRLRGAGDESGLGRQICWEVAVHFGGRFLKVNFASKKSDLGFALMNQLSIGEKHFPRSEQDIPADFFALRKAFVGTRWIFSEGRNPYNPASHCDIAWAGALASYAHVNQREEPWAILC